MSISPGSTGDQKTGADSILAGKEVVFMAPPRAGPGERRGADGGPGRRRRPEVPQRPHCAREGKRHRGRGRGGRRHERHVSLANARELVTTINALKPHQLVTVTRDGAADKVMALSQAVSRTIRIRAALACPDVMTEDGVTREEHHGQAAGENRPGRLPGRRVAERWSRISTVEMFKHYLVGLGFKTRCTSRGPSART